MDPKYRIYYGKYPDTCTIEIPNTHIRSVNFPSYRIEPGKPGEPKIDSYSFVLENFNQDGSERYDTAWFETNSRSSAEGATIPFQLFFRIIVADTNIDYVGVMDRKKPGRWNETVEVSVKHILTMALDGNKRMLKRFSFSGLRQYTGTGDYVDTSLVEGQDVEGNDIEVESMTLWVQSVVPEFQSTLAAAKSDPVLTNMLNHEFLTHLGLNDIDDWTISAGVQEIMYEDPRIAFVKIGEITMLTLIEVFRETNYQTNGNDQYRIVAGWGFNVWHANNSNIDEDDQLVLQRGRFFKDKNGTEFSSSDLIDVDIFDFNQGFDQDILVHQDDHNLDQLWLHGVRYTTSSGDFTLLISALDYDVVDILELTTSSISSHLFADLFSSSITSDDLFYTSNKGSGVYVFFADIMQYGWMNDSIGEVLVDLAMQTNSYLFVNEAGKIVFQDRLKHDSTLPDALPSGAFELQLSDINPLGTIDDSRGFESYEIAFKDRLEINNQELSTSYKKFVDQNGEVANASLRNSKVTIGNYRTSDLGVPGNNDHPDMPVFRYSPDHASFPLVLDLEDFIPDPVTQAQRFAASFSYPVRIWDVEISMAKYSQPGIGKYCWVSENGVNNVYLIKELHPNPDRMIWGLKLQYVGVYTP
jgi:hypothetical protein